MVHPATRRRIEALGIHNARLRAFGQAREDFGRGKASRGHVERKLEEYKVALRELLEAAQEEGAVANVEDWEK